VDSAAGGTRHHGNLHPLNSSAAASEPTSRAGVRLDLGRGEWFSEGLPTPHGRPDMPSFEHRGARIHYEEFGTRS
jgi:hypothetical protein